MKFSITQTHEYPVKEGTDQHMGVFIYAGSAELAVLRGKITELLLDYVNNELQDRNCNSKV
ncbi:MAG: hypothetical protein ACYS1A_19355 [Planctomycetota bacterium]|jgi:hypothetical protein